jgi:glyoxylase-like metal-dependent hydrolase (beta-lactamase superfamily II)
MQIAPEITIISRLNGLFNCYLVREGDSFTVVDTSFSFVAPEILKTAAKQGAPIRRILLTHAHGDHVGGLDALAAQLPGVEIAIGRRESRFLARDFSLDAEEPQTPLRGMFQKVASRANVLLEDGEIYGSMRVIATPGHTPGHLSFLHLPSGTLLAGDAISTVARLRVVYDSPWYFPFGNMATWHKPTALASVKKLAALGARGVAVGHGKPVMSGVDAAFAYALGKVSSASAM